MWPMLWQASLLILIVWALDLLLKRWAWPQVRHTLWLLVLLKLIMPPWVAMPTSLTAPMLKTQLTETQYRRAFDTEISEFRTDLSPQRNAAPPPLLTSTVPIVKKSTPHRLRDHVQASW